MTLNQIRQLLNQSPNDDDVLVEGFSPLNATKPGTLTWAKGDVPSNCKATAVICAPGASVPEQCFAIRDENPKGAFAYTLRAAMGYNHNRFVVIVGDDVEIQTEAVIGDDGWNYVKYRGEIFRFPHIGRVILGDRVEIQTHSCVARGVLGDTVLGNDVKLDRHVHIAHNCRIGAESAFAAGAILGGSIIMGERCFIGLGATIADNVTIGDDVLVGAGAVVIRDVQSNDTVVGNPARSIGKNKVHALRYAAQPQESEEPEWWDR